MQKHEITFATCVSRIILSAPMNGTNEAVINLIARAPGTNPVTINVLVPNITSSISRAATNATTQASTNLASSSDPITQLWANHPSHFAHIAIIVGLALTVHLVVRFIRYISEVSIAKSREKKNPLGFVTQQPKFVTLSRLIISFIVFLTYAAAIYIIIALEYPNDNTFKTYLTSAAVIGLALSFGLQGLVQDVVTCITLILSDAMEVGDTVDLMNGVIGRVERIGLRFVKVVNFYNQEISVPNRTIVNISRFPHGGILAYVDIQIPAKIDQNAAVATIQSTAKGVQAQFNAIILSEPVFSKVLTTPGNWNYMRVQFNIWPGQNAIMDTTFRSQMVNTMKTFDPTYSDWQVVVTYRAMA
jgi:small-conductance mechanosensitive channel